MVVRGEHHTAAYIASSRFRTPACLLEIEDAAA